MDDLDPKRRPDLESIGWPDDRESRELGHGVEQIDRGDPTRHSRPLAHHEAPEVQAALSAEEVDRLVVLEPGTRLVAGTTYLDLDDPGGGPFTGRNDQHVPEGGRIVSKRDVDHELWNRLTGDEH